MKSNKRGISLIVLMITIIVILILVTVIIMSFGNNNLINNANKAKFQSDLSGFKQELLATHADKEISDVKYNRDDVNVELGKYAQMRLYIPDITEEYADKLFIRNGNLLYIGDESSSNYDEIEESWAREVGVESPWGRLGDADGDGLITLEDGIYIQQYSAGIIVIPNLTDRQYTAMDVNKDGVINADDATKIQKFVQLGIDFDE